MQRKLSSHANSASPFVSCLLAWTKIINLVKVTNIHHFTNEMTHWGKPPWWDTDLLKYFFLNISGNTSLHLWMTCWLLNKKFTRYSFSPKSIMCTHTNNSSKVQESADMKTLQFIGGFSWHAEHEVKVKNTSLWAVSSTPCVMQYFHSAENLCKSFASIAELNIPPLPNTTQWK